MDEPPPLPQRLLLHGLTGLFRVVAWVHGTLLSEQEERASEEATPDDAW